MNLSRSIVILCCAAGLVIPAGAALAKRRSVPAPPSRNAPTPTPAGIDTARLKELDEASLSPEKKAELGLRFLQEEIAHPTPRPGPPYTDFKTHDYVLARIIRKLADVGADPATLRQARDKADGELKDCLTLALLLLGDNGSPRRHGDMEKKAKTRGGTTEKPDVAPGSPEAPTAKPGPASPGPATRTRVPGLAPGPSAELRDEVSAYVRDVKHPLRLRELAAEALGVNAVREQDPSVGPLLAELARRDPHSCYKAGQDGKPTGLVYPVKRAAVLAIQRMQEAKLELPSYVVAAASAPFERPLLKR